MKISKQRKCDKTKHTRSEPAKSTKWNLLLSDLMTIFPSSFSDLCCFNITEKMACDRDDTEFISVEPVVRPKEPCAR